MNTKKTHTHWNYSMVGGIALTSIILIKFIFWYCRCRRKDKKYLGSRGFYDKLGVYIYERRERKDLAVKSDESSSAMGTNPGNSRIVNIIRADR